MQTDWERNRQGTRNRLIGEERDEGSFLAVMNKKSAAAWKPVVIFLFSASVSHLLVAV